MVHQFLNNNNHHYFLQQNNINTQQQQQQNNLYFSLTTAMDISKNNNNNCTFNNNNNNNNNDNNNQIDKKRKAQVFENDSFNYLNQHTYNITPPPKYISFPNNSTNFYNPNNLIIVPIIQDSFSDNNSHFQIKIEDNNNNNNNNTISDNNLSINKRHQISTNEYISIVPIKNQEKSYSQEIKDSLLEESGWRTSLESEFEKDYFKSLMKFLEEEKESGVTISPITENIFRSFNKTPFESVKIVILGSDPPSGNDQANGFSFSIDGTPKVLPSQLTNIYLELKNDLGLCKEVNHGNLEKWATQGVLLLNNCLTVRKGSPQSHSNKGWETFTDKALQILSKERKGIVFFLWGKHAQGKSDLIDKNNNHTILTASHPSPYSALKGFFGCRHFSTANNILIQNNQLPIDWDLSNNNNNNNNNNYDIKKNINK